MSSAEPGPKKRRKRPRSRAEVDLIISTIAKDMATGTWISGISTRTYAERHEVSESCIRQWATQASRLVWQGDSEELETMKATTLARLDVIAAKAERNKSFTAAVQALDRMADIAGIKLPMERRVNVVLEGLRGSEEWQRLKSILTRAAIDFVDERDRERLMAAIDEFEGA